MARATPTAVLVTPRAAVDPTGAVNHEVRVESYRTEFGTFTRIGA